VYDGPGACYGPRPHVRNSSESQPVETIAVCWARHARRPLAQLARLSVGFRRVRPTDLEWPSAASWQTLDQRVGGRLVKVRSPLIECADAAVASAQSHGSPSGRTRCRTSSARCRRRPGRRRTAVLRRRGVRPSPSLAPWRRTGISRRTRAATIGARDPAAPVAALVPDGAAVTRGQGRVRRR